MVIRKSFPPLSLSYICNSHKLNSRVYVLYIRRRWLQNTPIHLTYTLSLSLSVPCTDFRDADNISPRSCLYTRSFPPRCKSWNNSPHQGDRVSTTLLYPKKKEHTLGFLSASVTDGMSFFFLSVLYCSALSKVRERESRHVSPGFFFFRLWCVCRAERKPNTRRRRDEIVQLDAGGGWNLDETKRGW